MASQKIIEISVTPIPAIRRKVLGRNSRGENMGMTRTEWIVRARTEDGIEGLTIADRYFRDFDDFNSDLGTLQGLVDLLKESLLGKSATDFLNVEGTKVTGVTSAAKELLDTHGWISVMLFDLLARELGVSCVQLLGGKVRDRVDAYDTTMYFQDLIVPANAAQQVAQEAQLAVESGYRQMKLKLGRGGRWFLPKEGMQRDVEVVLAVREAVGADVDIMVDANFGYERHLDLLETFVKETIPANVFWLEEMVAPTMANYRTIREIQSRTGSNSLIVCGEVDRTPPSQIYRDFVGEGFIDGYQPDIVGAGFAKWQELEAWLEPAGVRAVPHNFNNGNFGARADLIFGASSKTFVSIEDERFMPSVYKPDDFTFENGSYKVADAQGLGLDIDEDIFQREHAKHEVKITD